MPGHSRPHVHFGPLSAQQPHQNSRNEEVALLRFPSTKNILWDHSSVGSVVRVSLSYYRKPKFCIGEKVVRLAQKHLESSRESIGICALQGSLSVDDDGEGVTFLLDRFDPGGGGPISTNGLTPGDISVPFQMAGNSDVSRGSSIDEYRNALQLLKQKCCSKDRIDLSNFLLAKGSCHFYTTGEKTVHHIEFDVVTMATEFIVTPISAVPIVPTALSKNLSGPMSMSHLQGEPKTGYLTMDHTRKVLLVLESDPKVFNLPLVGIWISGVPFVYSPYVWGCFLRYVFNASIQDRVCVPPEPFLLVLYNPVHSKPEFYEVSTSTGSSKMELDLLSGYEVLNLPKMATCSSQNIVELELSVLDSGDKKRDTFDGALHEFSNEIPKPKGEETTSEVISDEITPRSRPAPHISQVPKVMPMVPEVSLLFGEDGQSGILVNSGFRKPVINKGHPNGVPLLNDFNNTPSIGMKASSLSSSHLPVSTPQNSRVPHHYNSAPTLQQTTPQMVCTGPCCVSKGGLPHQYMHNFLADNGAINRHSALHSNGIRHSTLKSNDLRHPAPQSVDIRHSLQPQSRQHLNYPQQPSAPQPELHLPTHHVNYNNNMQPQHGPNYLRYPLPPCACQDCQYSNHGNEGHTRSHSGHVHQRNKHLRSSSQPIHPRQKTNVPVMSSISAVPTVSNERPVVANGHSSHPQQPIPEVHQNSGNFSNGYPHVNSLSPRNNSVESGNSRSTGRGDSTGKSSDDSGLSVTPERPKGNNSQDFQQQPVSTSSEDPAKPVLMGNSAINWNQVPPEVYQLLMQQDAQLKQLQAQIQVLVQNQSASTQCTTTTELNSTSVSQKSKENLTEEKSQTCSIGTNTGTSMMFPLTQNMHSMSIQTSPQKGAPSRVVRTSSEDSSISPRTSEEKYTHSQNSRSSQNSVCSSGGYDARTPAEIRHRGVIPMNSTEREDFDMEMSHGECVGVANNVELHNATMNSIQSDMIVDMPSYHSSPSRSQASPTATGSGEFSMNSRSPISASMCGDGDPDSDESDGEDQNNNEENHLDADGKDYYDKLMSNINRLLHQESGDTLIDDQGQNLPTDTLQQSIMLGQYLNSMRVEGGQNPVETTFIPKINYMSMMFESDSDCSMEINAMAMKYLKDEQLTQLNKLQTQTRLKGNKAVKENQRLAMLRRVLSDDPESTPNVTSVGMSPNDMTFATRNYMEKHGLLSDTNSANSTTSTRDTSDNGYHLKVNFSMAPDSPAQLTQEVLGTPNMRKSRSPFLDSLRSQNTTGQSKSNNLDNYQSPHRTVSPLTQDHNTPNDTQSPCVKSYNTSSNNRTPVAHFTPSSNTPVRTKDTLKQHSARRLEQPTRSRDSPHLNSHNNPLRNMSRDSGNESHKHYMPQENAFHDHSDKNMSTPQGQHIGLIRQKNNTPSPVQVVDNPRRVLSPVTKESIPDPPLHEECSNEENTLQQREHGLEGDKILDITRLKLLPKLL